MSNKLRDDDAERSVIIGLLRDKKKVERALTILDEREFKHPVYNTLFKTAIKVYTKHGNLITEEFLCNYMDLFGVPQDQRLGYLKELHSLIVQDITDAEFEVAIRATKKAFINRAMTEMLREASDIITNKGGDAAYDVVDKKLQELKLMAGEGNFLRIVDIREVEGYIEYMRDMREHPEKYRGVPCGWNFIDQVTGGFQKGEYVVVLSGTGGGKSMTMATWAYNAWVAGYNVLYVSLELDDLTFRHRFLSLETGIQFKKIRTQTVSQEEVNKLENVLRNDVASRPGILKVVFWPKTTLGQFEAQLRQLKQNIPVDIVFVDYLGKFNRDRRTVTLPEWDFLERASRELAALARIFQIPIITAHQLTKEGANRGVETDLKVTDVAGSSHIPDPADMVVGVQWDKVNSPNEIKISVPKSRGGLITSHSLWCDMNICKIAESAPEGVEAIVQPPDSNEFENLEGFNG